MSTDRPLAAGNPSPRRRGEPISSDLWASIRQRCEAGESATSVARDLDVAQSVISRRATREAWTIAPTAAARGGRRPAWGPIAASIMPAAPAPSTGPEPRSPASRARPSAGEDDHARHEQHRQARIVAAAFAELARSVHDRQAVEALYAAPNLPALWELVQGSRFTEMHAAYEARLAAGVVQIAQLELRQQERALAASYARAPAAAAAGPRRPVVTSRPVQTSPPADEPVALVDVGAAARRKALRRLPPADPRPALPAPAVSTETRARDDEDLIAKIDAAALAADEPARRLLLPRSW